MKSSFCSVDDIDFIKTKLEIGTDIVVHSSTKNMSGHSAALGGVAIFREVDPKYDKLLNKKYADIHKIVEKAGKKAFMAICKKRAFDLLDRLKLATQTANI